MVIIQYKHAGGVVGFSLIFVLPYLRCCSVLSNRYLLLTVPFLPPQDERMGSGTGKRNGYQFFVCKRDFGAFVPIEAVIPEKVFDENPEQATKQETVEKQDQIHEDELYTRSMSCVNAPSGRVFS